MTRIPARVNLVSGKYGSWEALSEAPIANSSYPSLIQRESAAQNSK